MNEVSEKQICEPEINQLSPFMVRHAHHERNQQLTVRPEPVEGQIKEKVEIPDQDDRYPGSFFRIPGAPITGSTTWSLS
ncbi:MAG: hypothetical protein Q8N35_05755 [Methylococcaceae bacterium]|nr:hypothetical protein [Methylococcaceae bacterium]MDZ4156344.1 hypothetical protein [Methylococcales bacterium]MDP2394605.1 hypothetical protein [Methylococcaceae bacterium]MDP3019073.1 hypothetical protein [Methylococcaceae bacterium]MDP3390289.1 hypothetical protein [Methylococcaceae bacterium]